MVAALVLTGAAVGCSTSTPTSAPTTSSASPYDGGGVRVTATLAMSRKVLAVTFAPRRRGFHIYSLSLPPDGINGLGIPTRVVAGGSLRQTGPATADVRSKRVRIETLHVSLPVYPNGPVTITVPVTIRPAGRPRATVSFGACSDSRCLAPVRDAAVPVAVHD